MMFAFGSFHTCLPRIQIHLPRDLGHVEPCESVPNQRSTSGSLMTSPVYAPAAATTKRVFQRTQWPGAIQRVTILDNNMVRMLAWIGAIGASLKIWGKIRSLDYYPESCCSCLEIVSFLGQVLQVMRFYEIIRQSVFARFLCLVSNHSFFHQSALDGLTRHDSILQRLLWQHVIPLGSARL